MKTMVSVVLIFTATAAFSGVLGDVRIGDPPKTVNVDGGRQLFVDDYLVESSVGVVRHWNVPTKIEGPIIRPTSDDGTRIGGCAVATDGGLWWDPTIGRFRLWYEDNWAGNMRYAESTDGTSVNSGRSAGAMTARRCTSTAYSTSGSIRFVQGVTAAVRGTSSRWMS